MAAWITLELMCRMPHKFDFDFINKPSQSGIVRASIDSSGAQKLSVRFKEAAHL